MKTIAHGLIAGTLASVVLFVGPALAQVPIHDLGTLGGRQSEANAVNDRGQVAGWSDTSSGDDHAFLWTIEEGMKDLGTLGGSFSRAGGAFNTAVSAALINIHGQVVGSSTTESGEEHAFLWSEADGMIDLGTLGGSFSQAIAINDRGEVVGISTSTGELSVRGFLWTADGGMEDLGTIGGTSTWPNAVNQLGQVVGFSRLPSGDLHAFSWTREGGIVDLGTFGGPLSTALAVNELGQVAGLSEINSSEFRAFLWSAADGMADLGSLGGNSVAFEINDLGQVVGQSKTVTGEEHGFIWSAQAGMVDLGMIDEAPTAAADINAMGQVVLHQDSSTPDFWASAYRWSADQGLVELGSLGGFLYDAANINELGQIVGWSETADGDRHAALWGETRIADLWLEQRARRVSARNARLTLTVHSAAGCRAAEPEVCGFGATADAENVVLIDHLPLTPDRLEVVSLPPPCAYQRSTHTVTCRAPLFPRDFSVSLVIEGRLIDAAGDLVNVVNTATISSDTFDPNPDNNTVTFPRTGN